MDKGKKKEKEKGDEFPRLVLFIVCLLVIAFVVHPFATKKSKFCVEIVGSVDDVVQGRIQDFTLITDTFLSLGAGYLSSEFPEDIGEVLGFNGRYYVKSVREELEYSTTTSSQINAAFLMSVPEKMAPKRVLYVEKNSDIQSLYKQLIKESETGLLGVFGVGHFAAVHTSAVKKPPIFGENVLTEENRKRYFHPVAVKEDIDAFCYGIVISDDAAEGKFADVVGKAFYVNPADTESGGSGFQSHTHVGWVENEEKGPFPRRELGMEEAIEGIEEREVLDVFHLLTQTEVDAVTFFVFEFDRMDTI